MVKRLLGMLGVKPKEKAQALQEGEPVLIVSGALSDLRGTITELNAKKGKATVSFDVNGKQAFAELNLRDLEKLPEEQKDHAF